MTSQSTVVLTGAEILSLPRDIVLSVLFSWLEMADFVRNIDSNLCNHGLRDIYLRMLAGVIAPSTPADAMGESYLTWINSRKLKLGELCLERKSRTAPTSQFIDAVVQCCQGSLRELSLSHVYKLTNRQFLQIALACKSSLRMVEIDNCYDVDASVLVPLLSQANRLERLSLIGFDLSSLSSIPSSSSVTSLKLVTDVSPQAMQALLRACPLLQRLDLELDDQLPHQTSWIAQLAMYCPFLHTLHLNAYNPADHQLLQQLAQQLPALQELSVEEGVDQRGALQDLLAIPALAGAAYPPGAGQVFSEQFRPLKDLEQLVSLCWQGPSTTPRQMLALVGCFSALRKADFRYNAGVDNEVVVKLVRLNRQLEELVLPSSSENKVQLSDIAMDAIAKFCKALRVLSVPFGGAITDEGVNALGRAKALEELYLGPMPLVTEEGIMELGIQSEGRLKRLTICRETLSPELRRILCSLSIQVLHH